MKYNHNGIDRRMFKQHTSTCLKLGDYILYMQYICTVCWLCLKSNSKASITLISKRRIHYSIWLKMYDKSLSFVQQTYEEKKYIVHIFDVIHSRNEHASPYILLSFFQTIVRISIHANERTTMVKVILNSMKKYNTIC